MKRNAKHHVIGLVGIAFVALAALNGRAMAFFQAFTPSCSTYEVYGPLGDPPVNFWIVTCSGDCTNTPPVIHCTLTGTGTDPAGPYTYCDCPGGLGEGPCCHGVRDNGTGNLRCRGACTNGTTCAMAGSCDVRMDHPHTGMPHVGETSNCTCQ